MFYLQSKSCPAAATSVFQKAQLLFWNGLWCTFSSFTTAPQTDKSASTVQTMGDCGGLLATRAITGRLWVQNLFCISQQPVGEYTVFCNNQVVAGWLPTSLYACKTDLTDQSDCISRLTMLYGKISSNLRKKKNTKAVDSCWVHSVVRIELLPRDWLISYCIMSRRTGVPNKNWVALCWTQKECRFNSAHCSDPEATSIIYIQSMHIRLKFLYDFNSFTENWWCSELKLASLTLNWLLICF